MWQLRENISKSGWIRKKESSLSWLLGSLTSKSKPLLNLSLYLHIFNVTTFSAIHVEYTVIYTIEGLFKIYRKFFNSWESVYLIINIYFVPLKVSTPRYNDLAHENSKFALLFEQTSYV